MAMIEAGDAKAVPEGIRLLRMSGQKPFGVQAGEGTVWFRKDTYASQNELAREIRELSDAAGPLPAMPPKDAPHEEWVRWQADMDEYQPRANEAVVRAAALVALRRQTDKDGRLLFEGASLPDVVEAMTLPEARRLMAAYNAYKIGQEKVVAAVAADFP